MKEYFVFKEEYVRNPKVAFDPTFLRDYEISNKFPIERENDMVIICCPSAPRKQLRWYIKIHDIHLYGRIEQEVFLDEGLFEI